MLDDEERVALLGCFGIEMLPFRRVGSAGEAVAAASQLGFPVAIKATAEQWQHRVDGAGVRLMIETPQGARQAFTKLSRTSGRDEVYVQKMGPGILCVFALQDDPSFGSLLSFGLSGMASELLGDRAYLAGCLCRRSTPPSWSANLGRPRCCGATAASRPPGWTRWRTCCYGSTGWPRTCPRSGRWCSTPCSPDPTGSSCRGRTSWSGHRRHPRTRAPAGCSGSNRTDVTGPSCRTGLSKR